MDSSSLTPSSANGNLKYDLFISYRGADVRDGFISHLHAALCSKQIDFFIDDGLKRGDEIWPELSSAIEQSSTALVIFSKNYASSKWCLRELVKILECREKKKQIVKPVFYQVDPSDVRNRRGSFEDAFVNHENISEEEKQTWRAALTEASNLCGWDSSVTRPEAKLVDEIVKDVLDLLDVISPLSHLRDLVGINSPIEEVKSLLDLEKLDFRVVGIWGMGGLGKTTISVAVFQQISSQFEGCFFANIRTESENGAGLVHLRNKIFSKILGDKILDWNTPCIPTFIKRRLQKKKVFVVLDDVDDWKQLEDLTEGLDQFGPGSRVIIATRNKQLLQNCGVKNIYEVETLKYSDSLQLFSKYAFKHDYPPTDLELLVDRVVEYANGNPLALKLLGLSLNGMNKEEWESALEKFQRSLLPGIFKVLKISFDGLDDEEKDIFLDIACFYGGKHKGYVAKIQDDSDYSLKVLEYKALITISRLGMIQMHDLLQEMGQEIVQKESHRPSNRSRLWKQEDALRALKNNDVTDAIRGIFLDMSKITDDVYLSSGVFEKMSNLRFLKFYFPIHKEFQDFKYISKVKIFNGLNYISDELRSFQWEGCPLKVLPSSFDPKKLVELALPYSNVEQLWGGSKQAPKLKLLILHHCQQLTKIPDLSNIPLIEHINLRDCKSLLGIHSSILCLDHLRSLNLWGCKNLRSFPSNIHFKALERLLITNCINLTKFPHISGNLTLLFLCRTGIEEVPSSIQNLNKLACLDIVQCTRLKCISTSLCSLSSLTWLNLSSCLKLDKLPENFGCLKNLQGANLDGCSLTEIPKDISSLSSLEVLNLGENIFESFPKSMKELAKLKSLRELHLNGCGLTEIPKDIGSLSSLKVLNLGGNIIESFPKSIKELAKLKSLRELHLNACGLTEISENIGSLSSLKFLDLGENSFESLPKSMKELFKLRDLWLQSCNMLQSLTNLPSRLRHLDASNCEQLCQFFSDTTEFGRCSAYGTFFLNFINCPNLNHKVVINVFEELLQLQEKASEARSDYITIYIPGSEIPTRFSHRSLGSVVKIRMLLDDWWKCKGFALCAILGSEGYFNIHSVELYYCIEASDVYRKKYKLDEDYLFSILHIDSNQILLKYHPTVDLHRWSVKLPVGDSDHVDVSFEFKVKYMGSYQPIGYGVKYCAVHPINTEAECIDPIRANGINMGYAMGSSRRRSGKSDDHDKEVEPHPKRICTEANR